MSNTHRTHVLIRECWSMVNILCISIDQLFSNINNYILMYRSYNWSLFRWWFPWEIVCHTNHCCTYIGNIGGDTDDFDYEIRVHSTVQFPKCFKNIFIHICTVSNAFVSLCFLARPTCPMSSIYVPVSSCKGPACRMSDICIVVSKCRNWIRYNGM